MLQLIRHMKQHGEICWFYIYIRNKACCVVSYQHAEFGCPSGIDPSQSWLEPFLLTLDYPVVLFFCLPMIFPDRIIFPTVNILLKM